MRTADLRQLMHHRRVKLALKLLLGGFLSFVVVSFFGVPPLLRWAVESQGSKVLGRQVTVEHVSFNPLTLAATVEGLRIAEADGKNSFLSLGVLRANLSVSSLWYRGAVLDALRVEHPVLHVARLGDNRFNFSDIIDRLTAGPKPKDDGNTEPARFSVSNIELVDGDIVFDDRPVGRTHKVEHLMIGVPFVSTLPRQLDSFVQPKLEALINGSDFRLSGQVKPFADHREASLEVVLQPFDVTPYLVYVPGKLPVHIERAQLSSDLHVVWSSAAVNTPPTLQISGKLGLAKVALKDGHGNPLFAVESVAADIERIEPLAQPLVARISSVRVDAPVLNVSRAKDGQINLLALTQGADEPARAPAKASKVAVATPQPKVSVGQFALHKGTVHWQDEALSDTYQFTLGAIELAVNKLDLSADAPASLQLSAQGGQGERLALTSQLGIKTGRYAGHLALGEVGLEALRPYYAAAVGRAQIAGVAGLEGDFRAEQGKDGSTVNLEKLALSLKDLTVGDAHAKQPQVSLPETHADNISVDLQRREIVLGTFSSRDARLRLERDKAGLTLMRLLSGGPSGTSRSGVLERKDSNTSAESASPQQAWHVRLGDAALSGWSLHFDDRSGSAPVSLDVADLGLHVKDWSNQPGKQAQAELSAKVNKAGRIAMGGNVGTEPLKGSLRLDVRSVDFLAVQPYVDNLYRILVTKGNLSVQGTLVFDLTHPDKPDVRYAGNLAIADFNALDRLNNTDFMRWKRFSLDSVRLQTQPLAFATREIRLEDFYSRLILDEKGRLNVRELASEDDTPESPAIPVASMASAPVAAPVSAASAPAQAKAAMPQIRVDRIVLVDGHVNYSDRFVKPNYEANLLAVNGKLTGLSSDQSSMAALDVKASLDGAAPVSVSGTLNPLRQDSFLDILAEVRDVDLTGVSPYSAKFVGYGIEKGKLSMNVQYKIRDRQLTAENHVVLDQLTFGQKVDSPEATKLPVLFAVSLLKDRHGVIDINLPISGSLDDPQFSVGGVIVKVIMNLLSKAVTSPFSLIGSLFGGGEELSYIDFAPGSAAIPTAGEDKLKSLVKALVDRPALKLEIAGRADPVADATGLKRVRLDGKLRAVLAERMVKRGESVSNVDELKIAAADYPDLLKVVYDSEKIDAKPRNGLGLVKSLPVEEMERIILASYVITPDDLQALAVQRAQAVRARLAEHDDVSPERVFLLSAATATEPRDGKPAQARVEFSLK